jgi:hypothetical protein
MGHLDREGDANADPSADPLKLRSPPNSEQQVGYT